MASMLENPARTVALVLCGGEGTRLRPLTYLMRKEMLPVGRNRKPVLELVVNHLRQHGIRDIVFLGSREPGGDVSNYFGDGRRFGVRTVHQPDPFPNGGNGRALLWAIQQLSLGDRELLVYYGDMLTTVDLSELLQKHRSKEVAATLVVSSDYQVPKGVAVSDKETDMVIDFHEKPKWPGPGKLTVGLLCLDGPRLLRACGGLPATKADLRNSKYADIMTNIVVPLVERNLVASCETNEPWLDIGSFEDYARVQDNIRWLGKRSDDDASTKRGLTVFLSYKICDTTKRLVEELLVPSLEAAHIDTICGGTLDKRHSPSRSPTRHALDDIDKADGLVAIVTPAKDDSSPSDFVFQEVEYANGKDKLLGLFVQQGTRIPAPWYGSYLWTDFRPEESGAFVRDVLVKIAGTG